MGQSFNTVLTVNITLSEAGRDSTPTHTHAYTLHVNSWLIGLSYLIPPSLFLSSLFLSLALSSLSRFVYHRKMNNKCYGNIMSRPSFSPPHQPLPLPSLPFLTAPSSSITLLKLICFLISPSSVLPSPQLPILERKIFFSFPSVQLY